uniref:Ig-like domain-containing protein n=1 Tax=Graphocephala atropunctata TaxID=36148 RepID=A0A1B6KPF4_9HEMI
MEIGISLPKILVLVASALAGVGGLRDVEIRAPLAVPPGSSATLTCKYDLEGDPLYTVKWYKGRQEFFRYVPKELPHTRVFPLPGVNVDISASGPTKVVLRDVQKALSGKYRCEVSADAPNFHTQVVSTHMHVIHSLEGEPRILLEKTRYSVGDTLKGNCTAPPSSPPANITWVVNGHKALPKSIRHIIWRNGFEEDAKSMTIADLEFEVNLSVVPGGGGKLEVRCIADVYRAYATEAKVVLTEEKPRLASVLGTRESSLGSLSSWSRSLLMLPIAALVLR